jgi:hypothetical protein
LPEVVMAAWAEGKNTTMEKNDKNANPGAMQECFMVAKSDCLKERGGVRERKRREARRWETGRQSPQIGLPKNLE